MIAEECSITRLVDEAHVQVRHIHVLFNRVSDNLAALQSGDEETAEGGWRRDGIGW